MALRVGLVGCGDISGIYFRNAARFADFDIVACASRRFEQAEAVGARHGVPALSVDALIEGGDVDIVLNLTPPLAHAAITERALRAGKHVYSEKPLGFDLKEARRLRDIAKDAGRRLGVAPDTVLGPAVQTARRLIAEGAIGSPLFGTAAFMAAGPESFHPAPDFFYRRGGGPLADVGPYYLTALALMLGPVARAVARATRPSARRVIDVPGHPREGDVLEVEVPTTVEALLGFAGGAEIGFTASWDVRHHSLPHIEMHGTDGSLSLPNPDWFGGDLLLSRQAGRWETMSTDGFTFGRPNRDDEGGVPVADYRGLGLAEMAQAIEQGRPHRASDAIALHVVAIIEAIAASIETGGAVAPGETFVAPEPLTEDDAAALLA